MGLNIIDYEISRRLSSKDLPFASLIAAALRKADSDNFARLESVFPEITYDLRMRYNAPSGILLKDTGNLDSPGFMEQVRKVADSYLKEFD